MTDFPESHRDLLDAPFATLATIDDDGLPQLTELWFLYDEGALRLSLNTSRVKARNLERRPECSLLVLDLQNPFRYLEIRGRARIEPDEDGAFARKVGAKYDADLAGYDAPGEQRVVVTIEPMKIYAVTAGRAGAHPRPSAQSFRSSDVSWQLRAEERRRHDRDPVVAAIRIGAGRDHDHVEYVVSEPFLQPVQVPHVSVAGCSGELHVDRYDPPVGTLEDQVDFMVSACGSQVADTGFGGLRIHADVDGHQGLEQPAEQRPVARDRRLDLDALLAEQCSWADAEQPGR